MTKIRNPQVTVGLPVYNGEDFLAEAIESLLAQTFTDLELIISDNGSTDSTRRICDHYSTRDSRVHYLRNELNRGAAWNYNRLVETATGKYFKWAAHDDLCAPTFLERCVEVLDRCPEVVLCYPQTIIVDAEGRFIEKYCDFCDLRYLKPHERIHDFIRSNRRGMCNPVFGLIRGCVLRKTTMIQAYVDSDRSLLGQIALAGQIHEIPEPLFLRRMHPKASVIANPDYQSRLAWFSPDHAKERNLTTIITNTRFFITWRQIRDYLKAVARHEMTFGDMLKCYIELIKSYLGNPKWIYSDLRHSLGSLRRQLSSRAVRRDAPTSRQG